MFTPQQIRPLLEALSHSDAVIVGGQAINLWSETYQKDEEPWISLRPFTSRDLDALGSAAALLECSRHVQGQTLFPDSGQKTVNTGKLTVAIGGQEVDVDFLSEVKGLNIRFWSAGRSAFAVWPTTNSAWKPPKPTALTTGRRFLKRCGATMRGPWVDSSLANGNPGGRKSARKSTISSNSKPGCAG